MDMATIAWPVQSLYYNSFDLFYVPVDDNAENSIWIVYE